MSRNPQAVVAAAVREGLSAQSKFLPPFLLYDERGSALFEEITRLPEYYLTRTERSILLEQGPLIVGEAQKASAAPHFEVLELGAGTASKSQILLQAMAERQGHTLYVPADVSREPLAEASRRLTNQVPSLTVKPLVARHEEALCAARKLSGAVFVWFLGSSIGNYDTPEAVALLRAIRDALGDAGLLLLGADLKKATELLLPAYDDAQGVTAAFNKNVLARINRELGGHFELDAFRHVVVWNDQASRIEMHLESTQSQQVEIERLGMRLHFEPGERIHTESSHKYDWAHLEALFTEAGLTRLESFVDESAMFGVHLVRAN